MNKKLILYCVFLILTILPANANVIWPSLYIAKGMLSFKVIIAGLIIELLFVKYFTKIVWKKALIIATLMNLVTAVLGIALIPLSGLASEFVFDFVFHAYDKFGIGTFHWSHWLVSYILVVFINTFIESLFINLTLKFKIKKIFWWMLIANGISVLLCFLLFGTNI